MTSNTPDLIPSEDAAQPFDLDAWIDGISPTQRSVMIYARPDLFGRYEALQRDITVLERVAKSGEASVTDQEQLSALYTERETLFEQQQASKTTWYVQALDNDVLAAITKAHPVPDLPAEPTEPAKGAPQSLHDKYRAEQKKWAAKVERLAPKRAAAGDEQNLAFIAAAVVRIEDHTGRTVATTVTVEQLRAFKKKPRGDVQLGSLLTAAMQAKATEPVIPAPFSHAERENAPD